MLNIAATELTRNTREILDQVAARGESVNVERNRAIIVRIVPSMPMMTAAQALQGLRRAPMSAEQAQALSWLVKNRVIGALTTRSREPHCPLLGEIH